MIAAKENIPLMPGRLEKTSSALEALPDYESMLEVINSWLVNIPLDERAFNIQQYQLEPPER